MNQELPPGLADDEIHGLTQLVAKSLSEGESPEAVAQKLIDSGWESDQANGFVQSIQFQMMQTQDRGRQSELQGWMIWGGGIILINCLSWMFNWGFWIY
ncbi:MAG: hypothetical protein KDB00_25735 [Planctomycetales bacterium]|nr:hypothetical protein [Planctomycetales bacterium]